MMKLRSIILIFLLNLLLCFSCDFNTPMEEEKQLGFLPILDLASINIPENMVQSQDSVVQLVVKFIDQINTLHDYASLLNMSKEVMDTEPPWRSVWDDEGGVRNQVTLSYSESEDSYKWILTKSGIDSISGLQYNAWTALLAQFELLGGSKNLVVYEENTVFSKLNAFISTYDGTVYYIVFCNAMNMPPIFYFWYNRNSLIQQNGIDFNGHIQFFETLNYEFFWNNGGSGFWTATDDNNEIVESGSWN